MGTKDKVEAIVADGEMLTASDVAKTFSVAADTVRLWERKGLLPAKRTRGGIRLFRAEDVQRLACERAARRAVK